MFLKNFQRAKGILFFLICLIFGWPAVNGFAQDHDAVTSATRKSHKIPSSRLVRLAWEASSKVDLKEVNRIVALCLELYGEEAKRLQSDLNDFPKLSEAEKYEVLNDVGTCLFIQAELLMNTGQTPLSIEAFKNVIKEYPLSQAWDPSRGGFWSIAEKSQSSIDKLEGRHKGPRFAEQTLRTVPNLHTLATSKIVDYTKYGEFNNVGTEKYRYKITDLEGLASAVGEGIYPNTSSVYNNPRYKILKERGRLRGNHWDFVNSEDLEAAYFKWVTAPEPWGVRLFYIGLIFEKAKMYHESLRAYHALVVHFPKTTAQTYWQTPWYPAQAAVAKIRYILLSNPDLGFYDKWMKIQVKNGFDNDTSNDKFIVYPGRILKKGIVDEVKDVFGFEKKAELGKIKRKLGKGQVRLVQYENDHWQLLVEDKPYVIRGITYEPTRIGETPDKGTLENWMEQDLNENGLPDGPYDSWVDKNRNNQQDEDEPTVGDFQLMKEMGVNTLRFYHVPTTPHKEVLREMHEKFGFKVILGDFIGKYAIGSGATWSEGTDYENEEHKKKMMESVRKMVLEHKDEPYVLMWLLGNENNYGVASNADKKPKAYFKFANEVAKMIKSIDPNHPVALCNGDTLFLDIFAKYCPDIDIFAANIYRGNYGFGSFWEQVLEATGKAAFITEYGCPSYAAHLTQAEAEEAQADYLKGNWMDIEGNMYGKSRGVGNALGGVLFSWIDEWWKNYDPYIHDTESDAIGPFPGGYYFEEWFGVTGQGDGTQSPFLRHLKKSYFMFKEVWNK